MTVSAANGHASFLVPASSTAEQQAWLLWNGRPTANTGWTLEFSGHHAASHSAMGASQFQLVVVDPRALGGGTPYSFTCELSKGISSGATQAEFQSGNFAVGNPTVVASSLSVTDFRLRIYYRSGTQTFEAWHDDSGAGTNWKLLRSAALTAVQPDATTASEFVVGVIANCYFGPITEGQLWADNFRLVNSSLDVPVITAQPGNQTANAGSSVTFSVPATGATSYQWRKNGADLPGANSATYTIATTQAGDAAGYSVVVINANGGVTSSSATLTVNPAGADFAPASLDGSLVDWLDGVSYDASYRAANLFLSGTTYEDFSLAVVSNTVSYLSLSRETGAYTYLKTAPNVGVLEYLSVDAAFTNRTWRNTFTLSFTNATGGNYSLVEVDQSAPTNTYTYTGGFRLRTRGAQPVITTQPQDQTVPQAPGTNQMAFTVGASGVTPSYFGLRTRTANSVDGGPFGGGRFLGTNGSLSVPINTTTAGTVLFDLVVANEFGSVTSRVVTVTVQGSAATAPSITSQPQSLTTNSGATAAFNVTATGTAPLAYQWRKDGAAVTGGTNAALTLSNAQPANNGNYSVVITNAAGSVTSSVVSLTVTNVPTDIQQGLVAYYPFNGNANDESGLGKNGTIEGAVLAADRFGVASKAYSFDGINNRITTVGEAGLPIGTNDFTVSVWASVDQPFEGDYRLLVANRSSDQFQLVLSTSGNTGTIQFYTGGSPNETLFSPSQTWNDKEWYHVVVVRATNVVSIFRNGTVLATATFTKGNAAPVGSRNVTIGRRFNGSHPWKGKIDDVRIYDRALSAPEVGQLYASVEVVLPSITVQPQAQTVVAGTNVAFSVTATGTAPLAYQWSKNSANIAGATNATLTLTNVQPPNSGNYTVAITNAAGSVTSSVVSLTVTNVPTVVQQGLVAYYPFNGNANDESGLGKHGTVEGAVLAVDRFGVANQAYSFNGINNRITTVGEAGLPIGTNDFTISIWFSTDLPIAGDYRFIVGNSALNQFQLALGSLDIAEPNKQIQFYNGSGEQIFSPAQTWANGQWTHVVVTRITNQVSIYRNSVLLASQAFTGGNNAPPGSRNLTIGRRHDGGHPWKGRIDDVRIYNRALSPTEVSQLYAIDGITITSQPMGQSFSLGGGVALSVGATGGGAGLFYQWQHGGTNLIGATSPTLTLTNLAATNAGTYRVIVSNTAGVTVTSQDANLLFYGDLKFIASTVLAGPVGQQFRVDYADVVTIGTTNWLVLTNITLPSSPYLVIDPNSAGRAQRYYRAVPLP